MSLGGGKQQPQGSRTVYGHCAGIISLGPIDWLWGIMINNVLVWPGATIWSQQSWPAGKVLFVGGNAYITSSMTTADPPSAPWSLFASAWVAGTYAALSRVVRNGGIYETLALNSLAPPASPPAEVTIGSGSGFLLGPVSNGWTFIGGTDTFGASAEWPINSIVAWKGRLYTNSSATTNEPPAAPWTLWKQPRAGFPNPLKITIGGYGDAYIYWGTQTQTLDTVNEQVLNNNDHPAYRNRAVIVIKDFLFGTETTTPPDIQVLAFRNPVQTLITGAAADPDADWQVNPWCVLAEALTHPIYGLGLPDSFFDATTWQAEADRCAASPDLYYISPLWESLLKVRDIVSELMGYPDAYIFWNVLGQIQAGHWPHGEAAPSFDATNTVNRDTLIAELSADSQGWGGTANSIELGFCDIQAAFKNRSVVAPNLFNRTITRRLLNMKVDRPFIVRSKQALAWANEMAKIAGDPSAAYSSTVRAERVTGIRPGSLFLVTDDVLQTSQVHRCTQKTLAALPDGSAILKHELERGVAPLPFSPTPLIITPPTGEQPLPITDFQFVQLPAELGGGRSRIACLAARSDNVTNVLEFWYQQTDNSSFQKLGTAREFGIAGTVSQSINTRAMTDNFGTVTQGNTYNLAHPYPWNVEVLYNAGGGTPATPSTETDDYIIDYKNGTITIVVGGAITTASSVRVNYASGCQLTLNALTPTGDIELIAASQTLDQIADNTILLFLFQAGNPTQYEICAVTAVAASGGNYDFSLKRQQYSTLSGGDGSYVWTSGDYAIAVFRRDVVPLYHRSFPALQAASGVARFVLAPGSPFGLADVDDVYDAIQNPSGLSTKCLYTFNNVYAPTVTWVEQNVNGGAINFATTYLTTDKFTMQMYIQDQEGDCIESRLTAENGHMAIEVGHAVFKPIRTRNAVATFTIPLDGTWQLFYTLRDQSGNVVKYPMTAVGGGSPVQITIDSSGGTVCVAPVASPPGDSYASTQRVTLTSETAGATLHYSIVAYGSPPGGYTTYTGPIAIGLLNSGSRKTLWAYTSKGGMTDSYVSRNDYFWDSVGL